MQQRLSIQGFPAWPLLLGAALLALLAAAVSVRSPTLGILLGIGVFALAVAVALRPLLPRIALSALGICLLGYAFLGKGFAYLGAPPLYVGELSLLLCLTATLTGVRLRVLGRSPVVYLLGLYMLLGLAATLPQISVYGLDSLRDAVLWGYGLFAVCVAALLLGRGLTLVAAQQYVRFVPLFLVWTPLAVLTVEFFSASLPRFPGSNITLIEAKGGDIAVHLAGIAALLLLGLPRLLRPHSGPQYARLEWLAWGLWLAAAGIPVFRVRAGLLAITAAVAIIVLLRRGNRWSKPAIIVTVLLSAAFATNAQITLGESRNTISAQALLLNVQSITGQSGSDAGAREGTKRWRLNWWTDIVNYTVHGPYFWTGKGYGINLADADGYQLGFYSANDTTLRSPHSAHFNVLARSGVPGLAAWVLLQVTFALSLLRAYLRASRAGQELWAKLNLWVLAYWAAFMVNASFDVYLEGPQGGIWFWSVFGFGIALIETQRRGWHLGPHPRQLSAIQLSTNQVGVSLPSASSQEPDIKAIP